MIPEFGVLTRVPSSAGSKVSQEVHAPILKGSYVDCEGEVHLLLFGVLFVGWVIFDAEFFNGFSRSVGG
jgi:hypothetical protein